MERFEYLIEKIRMADFTESPFKHIYIENFFSDADFAELLADRQITLDVAESDETLFEDLFNKGYEIIAFPGCIVSVDDYLRWRRGGKGFVDHTACSSTGMVMRLHPRSDLLKELDKFLNSTQFNRAVAERLNVDFDLCDVDCGIQKYFDGYEISPHPDTRRKAATYMININPHEDSAKIDYHTHYLKFKDKWSHIGEFWKTTPQADRDWVPWDWCDTAKTQFENNSIVLFSPSDDTLHAVRANYDHLETQRTQLYGNLWFESSGCSYTPSWEQMQADEFDDLTPKDGFGRGLLKSTRKILGSVKRKVFPNQNFRKRKYR